MIFEFCVDNYQVIDKLKLSLFIKMEVRRRNNILEEINY